MRASRWSSRCFKLYVTANFKWERNKKEVSYWEAGVIKLNAGVGTVVHSMMNPPGWNRNLCVLNRDWIWNQYFEFWNILEVFRWHYATNMLTIFSLTGNFADILLSAKYFAEFAVSEIFRLHNPFKRNISLKFQPLKRVTFRLRWHVSLTRFAYADTFRLRWQNSLLFRWIRCQRILCCIFAYTLLA